MQRAINEDNRVGNSNILILVFFISSFCMSKNKLSLIMSKIDTEHKGDS
jgi:hypothetical protein